MKYEHHDHRHSRYERPSCGYRCGRERFWQQPCWQGPDCKGRCGGTQDCAPRKQGDRWYCQRPETGGGPCTEGPLPDGQCPHQRRACSPTADLRRWRGRLSLFVIIFAVLALLLYSGRGDLRPTAMLDPGPLHSAHSGLLQAQGCESCHAEHKENTIDWLLSAFKPHDMTGACLDCHQFAHDGRAPHNHEFPQRNDLAQIECRQCHKEHMGAQVDLTAIDQRTCGACHEQSFTHFADHIALDEQYPHEQPQPMFFDHASHLQKYFSDPDWLGKPNRDAELGKKAKADCRVCHADEQAGRSMPIRPYEEICASCHDHQIQQRPLVLMTADGMTEAGNMLLPGLSKHEDDPQALLQTISEDGLPGLIENEGLEQAIVSKLFAGLNDLQLRRVSKDWQQEDDYSGPAAPDEPLPGWQVAETEDGDEALLYRARGHRDRLLQNWIEHALQPATDNDAEERRIEVLDILLDDSEGAGACAKCHATLAATAAEQAPQWAASPAADRPMSAAFVHQPHLPLLGPNGSCDSCHKLSDEADFPAYYEAGGSDAEAFENDFSGIVLERCQDCHAEPNGIAADCLSCHQYHNGAGFTESFINRATEDSK